MRDLDKELRQIKGALTFVFSVAATAMSVASYNIAGWSGVIASGGLLVSIMVWDFLRKVIEAEVAK